MGTVERLHRDGEAAQILVETRAAFDQLIGPDTDRTLAFSYDEPIDRTPGGKIRTVIREF